MPRFALKIEYHGAGFHGWQRQRGLASVQESLERALRRLDPEMPPISAAGRTDTGVHALGQVAHCDLSRNWDPYRLSEAVNFHLKPNRIAVVAVAPVDDAFHARFSAIERRYKYRIISRRAPLTHDVGLAWRIGRTLDLAAMQTGAAYLVGHHDFTTFRASECQAKTPVKTVDAVEVTRTGDEFQVAVRAPSFLHNQVRSFVGTLERVGAGSWAPEDVGHALEARNRAACGPVAPPDGLYLEGVRYPEDPFG